jgi:hypothetical protein
MQNMQSKINNIIYAPAHEIQSSVYIYVCIIYLCNYKLLCFMTSYVIVKYTIRPKATSYMYVPATSKIDFKRFKQFIVKKKKSERNI